MSTILAPMPVSLEDGEERFYDAQSRTPSAELEDIPSDTGTATTAAPTTPEERNVLVERVLVLIDFYFGDANFSKDQFLRKHASSDPSGEGWIPVDLVCSFKKMKLLTTDSSIVLDAMKRSSVVMLNEAGDMLRRKDALENFTEDVLARTIHFSVPHGTDEKYLREVCCPFGEIARVRILDPATDQLPADIASHCRDETGQLTFRQLPGSLSAFVQYGSIKQAGTACRGLNAKKDWRNPVQVDLIFVKAKAPGSGASSAAPSREGSPAPSQLQRSRASSFHHNYAGDRRSPAAEQQQPENRPRSNSFNVRRVVSPGSPGSPLSPPEHTADGSPKYTPPSASPGSRRRFLVTGGSSPAVMRSGLSQVESAESWRSPVVRSQSVLRMPIGPSGAKGFTRVGCQ